MMSSQIVAVKLLQDKIKIRKEFLEIRERKEYYRKWLSNPEFNFNTEVALDSEIRDWYLDLEVFMPETNWKVSPVGKKKHK